MNTDSQNKIHRGGADDTARMHWPCPDRCDNWRRTDIKFEAGEPLPMTNHHPSCKYVDESLIDVWRFSHDGSSYVTDVEPSEESRREAQESSVSISKEKMHREIYNHLKEFKGF